MPRRRKRRENAPGTPDEALATVGEVAAFLRVPANTLYRWRYAGEGPPAYRVGKYLRFRWEDVDAWLSERRNGERGSGRRRAQKCHKGGADSGAYGSRSETLR